MIHSFISFLIGIVIDLVVYTGLDAVYARPRLQLALKEEEKREVWARLSGLCFLFALALWLVHHRPYILCLLAVATAAVSLSATWMAMPYLNSALTWIRTKIPSRKAARNTYPAFGTSPLRRPPIRSGRLTLQTPSPKRGDWREAAAELSLGSPILSSTLNWSAARGL